MKPRLMILEDDTLTNNLYKYIFSNDFETVICTNDIEFYVALSESHYDFFIVDIALPGNKDGFQLIRELRQIDKYIHTPIFVITANQYVNTTAIDSGATKFFCKPINSKEILNEIKQALA